MKHEIFNDISNIAVVGDLMLDRYVYGKIQRISQEAPVPIVEVMEEKNMLGGAGNVAANIVSLGGRASLIGIIGKDNDGEKLLRLCKDIGVSNEGILQDGTRPTTLKTRIVAERQQVLRIDKEEKKETEKTGIVEYVKENINHWDAFVISDYAKGCVTETVAKELIGLASQEKKPIIVDTKPEHINYMEGATLITPNKKEALEMTGKMAVEKAGEELRKKTRGSVIITQGGEGMTLFEGGGALHVPAETREVFDVSGAGDTVVAVLALALANNWSLNKAARLANVAAGIVVGKSGTATATVEELKTKWLNYDRA